MSGIFLVAAKRTPFGAFGGSLKGFSATDLGVVATQAALQQANHLDPALIDNVFFGNVIQSSADAAYLSRHVALRSGCQQKTPCLTINRLCGSGFETVILGANSIKVGDARIVLCGGSENMSDAPMAVSGNDARWGVKLGAGMNMRDSLWDGLTDSYSKTPMGVTAENLAKKYNITREVRCNCDCWNILCAEKCKILRFSFVTSCFLDFFLPENPRNATNLHYEVSKHGRKRRKLVFLT